MLDRIGEEVARATSIVRFSPDSSFSEHTHGGGEEFFVLDGVFSDEYGDCPAGFYVRNPPSTTHAPRSAPGCVLFVKLWQFNPSDRVQVRVDTKKLQFTPALRRQGVDIMPLFVNGEENVRLERWAPHTRIDIAAPGGLEVLVLSGDFNSANTDFEPQSWLRLPPGAALTAKAGAAGCKVWVKTDHLSRPLGLPPARGHV